MITAQEARDLADRINSDVIKFTDGVVDCAIREALERHVNVAYVMINTIEETQQVVVTKFQSLVVKAIKDAGFECRIGLYGESYNPRGLDDNETLYQNYGYIIGW